VRAVPRPARDTGSAGVTGTHRPAPPTGAPRPTRETGAPTARGLPRDTGGPETRVDNLPPAPEPGADQLPPPPAVPLRAASAIPRTPSYSDEIVSELDTRERPRLSSEDIDKIASPPPTVPTEQIVLDDDQVTPPPQMQWNERRARPGGPPIRDTPMDPPTDIHTSLAHGGARDTSLDMHTEAGTDVQRMGRELARDTRRDAAAEPPEDERTAPRELVGSEPLANAFFLAIPLNRREAALTRCIKRVVRAGQTVVRQGETSHPLYLVVSGQLELRVERANGTLAKIDEIDAGQYIGEGSLLARSPAIAHVIASATSELLALPPHALFELAGAYPALWAMLKDSAERRARAYEKLLRG
jgi:CRP-like cAMP-binding protein